jgi:simple sugar transport system ATP-binding protein
MDVPAIGLPAIELIDIHKSFDSFKALDGASFAAFRGEVHALLGENGAGKSSLMNVAAGLYRPDAGQLLIDRAERHLDGPQAAAALRIGMVHQHFKLVKTLSVAENVLLGLRSRGFRRGLREVAADIERRALELGLAVDPARIVGTLSVAEQQRVEILKVLAVGAEIVILDEPTALLTDEEAHRLLTTMRGLAAKGAAVLMVTHKLHEVTAFADRVTVMRGGRSVGIRDPRTTPAAELAALAVGSASMPDRGERGAAGPPVLVAQKLRCLRSDGHVMVPEASFAVRRGEIYGIAGVGGNGQSELFEALIGVTAPVAGTLRVDGSADIATAPPHRRRDLGIAAIPADRARYGLAGSLSIADNFAVSALHTGRFGPWWRIDHRRIRQQVSAAITAFEVLGVRSPGQKASRLSGGNAQKLVIAREFSGEPRVIIAQSPSRGLDLRATAAVHRRLLQARQAGAAVLLMSEDLDEVMTLSDRIGVMRQGRIAAEFTAPADRQAVGRAMVDHV